MDAADSAPGMSGLDAYIPKITKKQVMTMIRESFIFLDKIGPKLEQQFWSAGINNWEQFSGARDVKGISPMRKAYYDRQISQAESALADYDAEFFTNILSPCNAWRLYDFFKDDAVFLDIETSGYYGDITVIGLYDGRETMTMVKGFNLDREILRKTLERYNLVITFNGSSFDLPVIERYFQGVLPSVPHIDLRHVCAKIGLVGGLKAIEQKMGIIRQESVQGISGEDAVYLWQKWKTTGNRECLQTLVEYNEEDIINLKPIAEKAVKELWSQIRFGNLVEVPQVAIIN